MRKRKREKEWECHQGLQELHIGELGRRVSLRALLLGTFRRYRTHTSTLSPALSLSFYLSLSLSLSHTHTQNRCSSPKSFSVISCLVGLVERKSSFGFFYFFSPKMSNFVRTRKLSETSTSNRIDINKAFRLKALVESGNFNLTLPG